MKKKQNREKLQLWQGRLARGQAAYDSEGYDFTTAHAYYEGSYKTIPGVAGGKEREVTVLRNICDEIVEAQVSSSIPMPRVTALRAQDEEKAMIIEEMLRDMVDRLPFEELNDIGERMVPTYAGCFWMTEWDNEARSKAEIGECRVRILHPKQIVPQPGITEGVHAMDYIISKIPMTRREVEARYHVVIDGSESEPQLRSGVDEATVAEDLLTVYIGYEKNSHGGIDMYGWCLDTELCDLENYQARRQRRCKRCGASESEALGMEPIGEQTRDGEKPTPSEKPNREKNVCPFCGSSSWEEASEDYMEFYTSPLRSDGTPVFEDASETVVGTGEIGVDGHEITTVGLAPIRVPCYRPDVFPLVVQRNISVYGKLLGESDVLKAKTYQDAINRLQWKITEKAINAGSWRVVPSDCELAFDDDEGKRYVIDDPSKISMFKQIDMQFDISQELQLEERYYQAARQATGLTDSYQGRRDTTAQSGKAKEISAAQAAGRFESKRRMKEAAYAAIYETLFKFRLAYADEVREVRIKEGADVKYKAFNKWDFLEKDENGEFFWNDMFRFSCDTASPLAENREAMWAQTKENFSAGTFGDPGQLETLIFYWGEMEHLHYPGASTVRGHLEEQLRKQEEAAEKEAAMQEAIAPAQQMQGAATPMRQSDISGMMPGDVVSSDAEMDPEMMRRVIEQAKRGAAHAVGQGSQMIS